MSSAPDEPSSSREPWEPRVCNVPEHVSSVGAEAAELSELAGLTLDPWQAFVLDGGLGQKKDGKWAAFEVGLVVPRQNGKGSLLEARELAGLFLLGERLIIHSAHQFDTSLEAFRRLLFLIEDTPEFDRRVRRVSRSHGEEGIELKGGQRIRFRTRTKGGGRGFSGDCLSLDEPMILPESVHGALLPTLSARPNPQVWYTGSAVDQQIHEDGLVFSRVRRRGHAGDPSLAYFEWSIDCATPDDVTPEIAADRRAWAQANPGLGIRITEEHVANERASLDARGFAVERLSVGDWPDPDGEGTVISLEQRQSLVDPHSKIVGPVCLAFDVPPDRSTAAIAAAGLRADGAYHVEIIEFKRGTGWVPGRLVELVRGHNPIGIIYDGAGPASSLVAELANAMLPSTPVTAKEHGQACGLIYDAVDQAKLHHLGTPELANAIRGARKRPLGDAWAWSRKGSNVDISPLVAVTLALWGAAPKQAEPFALAW